MYHIVYGSSTYVRNQLWPNLFGIIWLKVLYSTDADDDNKSAAQTKFAKTFHTTEQYSTVICISYDNYITAYTICM